LHIPREPDISWVIDGQHRLFGLHLADSDLPVSVAAFIGLSLEDQVALFIKINSTQKGVPASLYLDLLEIVGDEDSIDRKIRDLIDQLNSDVDSPWYNNINMTGEGKGAISLVNFSRRLKPLIAPDNGDLRMYTFEEQYKILFNYFTAIKAVFLDQWDNGKYTLTKTVGFGALMSILPFVINLTIQQHGTFSANSVVKIFNLINDLKFDAETIGAGTGNKAETFAGKVICEKLSEVFRETRPEGALIRLED
jgi:DGQHR domain-containing protein